ncbi:MAG: ribose ABC transporter permease [Deltaproteobacteria bacterium]|nr:MAG: ribose ABC transporter permease [Deltaproteobacteria bacterium]
MSAIPTVPSMLFLRKFLAQGPSIASLAPSSTALAEAMCRFVDDSRPQVLLELGAGTGAVTEVVARRMHPDSVLFAVERDEDFAALAQARVPRARVLHGDVLDLHEFRALSDRPDVILSGLPTPNLPLVTREAVLGWMSRYAPDAAFSQLTALPWLYHRFYDSLFADTEFELVPWSLPPGGVYHCFGVRPDRPLW